MPRQRYLFVAATVGMACAITITVAEQRQEATTAAPMGSLKPGGLARVFEPGWLLTDRNGDTQTDFVSARIVIPTRGTAETIAAATAFAARLGLETSGLTFPLVFRASEDGAVADTTDTPTIVIGTDNANLPEDVVNLARALDPGQGVVTMTDTGVAVAGRDPAGTQAAAEAFAARSPYLWAVIGRDNGDTYERVVSDLIEVLSAADIETRYVDVESIVYEAERSGALRANMRVTLASGQVDHAYAFLDELTRRHRRGLDTSRLSYASLAELVLHLTDGLSNRSITLPRVGLPPSVINPPRRRATRFQTVRPTRPAGSPPPPGRKFDLTELFVVDTGVLLDRDNDRIPDDTDLMIVVPAGSNDINTSIGAAHLGARLGLESTGLTFPLLGFDTELEDPEIERRPLVLIGRDNELVDDLEQLGKLRGETLQAGLGRIEVVPEALNESSAVIVTGGDLAGEEAALDYLSRRAPSLWDTARGAPTLGNARQAVKRLLDGRVTAAQAALIVAELDELIEDLSDLELDTVTVDVYLENRSKPFEDWLSTTLSERLDVESIPVTTFRHHNAVEVFREEPNLEWEVDRFWERFQDTVLPRIKDGTRIDVELRVSESPKLRTELADRIRNMIAQRGGTAGRVAVLSAFKQGLSWLMDDVAPRLVEQSVERVEIAWRPLEVDTSGEARFYNEPARWLNELYPADDVLGKTFALPLDAFSFVSRSDLDATYLVTVSNAAGEVLLTDQFSPKHYERPYLESFPNAAQSIVTTGWLTVRVDDAIILDERLPTDLDRIWDHYQGSTLARIYEHIKSTTDGKPTSDKTPYFHTLRIDLEASEPDFRLDIDEEQISSLESLHDSFYFDTLDFLYEVAEDATERDEIAPRSLAAGNVLPWIHPERRGQAPSLVITYSGFASKHPKVVVTYKETDGEEQTEIRTFEPIDGPDPYLYLAEVANGADTLASLGFLVTLDEDEGDDDSLGRLTDLLENLSRLQEDGLFMDAFDVPNVDEIEIRIEALNIARTRTYAVDSQERTSPVRVSYPGDRLVTWDHIISPDESERIAHTLGMLPNVTTYVAGESYQGRPVSVMEIMLPMESELVSQAKLSTWKPVLSIVGRQHANEVSSTSHILRLAELLATNPEYEHYLNDMNVVIQPVVNPDGAALAFELQQLTPYHCLHAGRYSALGPDVPGQADNPDTLLTEALVLSKVTNTWLPDVRLNPHGYPSHEWVQHFANYNPKSFRSYWIPRGWWTDVRIPEHPGLRDARNVAVEIRDRVAEEMSRDAEVRATNLRIYDRYDRWALRWQPHVYNLELHNDTAIYSSRRSGTVQKPGTGPQTIIFSGMTEAMDETAQAPWLDLVTRMGFGYLMASVKFLSEAEYELYRLEEQQNGRVHISVTRPRPIRPGRK